MAGEPAAAEDSKNHRGGKRGKYCACGQHGIQAHGGERADADFPAGRFECWLRIETAQGEAPQITFPESARFLGAEPEFAAGRCYEISVKDGVCIVAGEAA